MKTKIIINHAVVFAVAFQFLFASVLLAQPGGIDPGFTTGSGFTYEAGKNAAVYSIALQPDGKIIIGGQFSSFNGTKSSNIVRLNADGTQDQTFSTGEGFNKPVRTITLQTDGKIIVGGEFTSFDSKEQNHIIRLNSDGSKDETFNVGSSFNDIVYSTLIQPDGNIVVGGKFTNYNGSWQNNIVRINSDGKLDLLFYTEKGFNDIVYTIALQNDGKIIAGGAFTAFNGSNASRIIRLTDEGKADGSFISGSGFDNIVRAISIDANNSIIAGGYFSQFNGKSCGYIAKINSNGSLDDAFKSGTGFNGSVQSLLVQPDRKIIAGGYYTSYNGTERKNISRLNADGTLDISFVPGKGASAGVMAIQQEKKIFLGGSFTTYNDVAANQVCRIISDPYIVSVSNSEMVCAGGNFQVEFSSEGNFAEGNIFTVQLSDAEGSFSTPVNIGTLTAVSGGTINATIPMSTTTGMRYRVRLTTSKPALTSKPNDVDIRINAVVTPSLSITSSSTEPVCAGTEIKFTAVEKNGGISPFFQWKINGNNVGENNSHFAAKEFNNGDNITCVLTSNANCLSQNNVVSNAVITKVNPLVTPTLSIAASPAEKICEHAEVKFNAQVTNGGPSPAFQWKKNGIITGVNSISYSDFALKNADEITCIVTSNAQCLTVKEATSNAVIMKVNPDLTPAVKIMADFADAICPGTLVKFTAEPENAGVDPLYQWKKNGKNVGTNSSSYSDGGLQNGDEISCVITTSAQCFSQKEATSNYIELALKKCD